MTMSIGQAAKRSGCSLPTLRYYEEIGLVPPVDRAPNGRRVYGWPEVSRFTFIRRSRDLGLSIADIRTMLAVADKPSDCDDARQVILSHLEAVRTRRSELQALEGVLKNMADKCGEQCAGTNPEMCTIVEDLSPYST